MNVAPDQQVVEIERKLELVLGKDDGRVRPQRVADAQFVDRVFI